TCTISYNVVLVSVSFDIGSADVIVPTSQTIVSGLCAIIPALAVEGYTVAWYSDSELTTSFDFTSVIIEDTTIYLGLTAVVYTVSFDVGISDLIIPASQTIESGSCAAIPDLTVDGFTVKWYSDPTLTAEYDFASSITADTTLYLGLTAVVVPVDPDPQTDEGLTSDVDSMLIAGLILLIIGIITLVCMFAIGFPPINPIVIIVDLAVIAAGAILIFFGV
ncbi:MAG: InlB B-repeat-containing protein, partial [Candidatus Methanomethylophilaceae archaeon]|nr:InlB B-repeat-containing protein [Candidatus Methanomethylophilaceae archaeon]